MMMTLLTSSYWYGDDDHDDDHDHNYDGDHDDNHDDDYDDIYIMVECVYDSRSLLLPPQPLLQQASESG